MHLKKHTLQYTATLENKKKCTKEFKHFYAEQDACIKYELHVYFTYLSSLCICVGIFG